MKIGVITHYYRSINYGGNLQAYALCEVLNKNEMVRVEQVTFKYKETINLCQEATTKETIIQKLFSRKIFKLPQFFWEKLCWKYNIRFLRKLEEQRMLAFVEFNENQIPHSQKVYNSTNIIDCANDYDVFITGSDQVWNLIWYNSAFFLDFVPSEKIKMSYSASVAMNQLSEEQKEIFKNSLKDYKAVSVREKSAVSLLEGLSPVPVVVTLDPTLLLTKADWDKVCADRVIQEEYIFCYFLGDNKKSRKITRQFAKKCGLKIIAVPYAGGYVSPAEQRFGDERLIDVSPQQFLSLVKHARYIFTDSFHAVVFSNIYQKQYFVFNRTQKDGMSSRITDITELFEQSERFCAGAEKENIQYVESLSAIDYSIPNEKLVRARKESVAFLRNNLEI